MFLYSGGELLVRKKDIIRLCEAHPDCQFTVFTNGTLIDEAFADGMLRDKKLPFGISCCYTSQNVEVIGSKEYFDQLIAWSARFFWFFTYMPVGKEATVMEFIVSVEQRVLCISASMRSTT